jgi:ADP-heptose:LPS heptosyltransferase
VFRIGQLGDTIVALPALWALKKSFPEAELTLLCDRHPGKAYVFGPELFQGTGFFKQFEFYPVREGAIGRLWQGRDMLRLLLRLRRRRFDTLVYLAPSGRTRHQIARDRRFFRAAGINHFIGDEGIAASPVRKPGRPLDELPHEADLLLARMAASGIPVPAPGKGCMDLRLGPTEKAEVYLWLDPLPPDKGRTWVGFGPGSKMPAKQWPLERFLDVGQNLIDRFDVWPVVFGGTEDAEDAARLLEAWGRGYNAARLSVRGAALALKRCALYVGNDTGTMHLAAAAGIRCVAVFSARDWPGTWYPYGPGHRVFRAQTECEGCNLFECVQHQNECLRSISAAAVAEACEAALREVIHGSALPTSAVRSP